MDAICDQDELNERLSRPTPGVVEALESCPGDIVVLGVAGKVGVTLAMMARRALDKLGSRNRVIGVSRFSSGTEPQNQLRDAGIEPVSCDLLDRDAVRRLPDASNVFFLAGQKFGTSSNPELTWAINTLAPAICAEKYGQSRFVAFSTGCVYPLTSLSDVGSSEEDELGPPGDYANSCVGRERILSYYSREHQVRTAIIRLNYAIDLRYGVLLDIAQQVWNGEPVDVTMGHVNVIWQGDANAQAIQCLPHASAPPFVINITGPDTLPVRSIAAQFGAIFGRTPIIGGVEAPTAWLSNASRAERLFGRPSVSLNQMVEWVAAWVSSGKPTLGKPTHFAESGGKF